MASKRTLDTPEKGSTHPKKLVLQTPAELDSQAAGPGGDSASPPAWFVSYLERFNRLEERIDSLIINRLEEVSLKTKENEEKIDACCIQVDTVVAEMKKLKQEKDDLLLKLDDLENRGRRNNLVLHGVPEKAKENCLEVVQDFISNFVGVQSSNYAIERCHRTPTTKVLREGLESETERVKPRIIHIAFSTYVAKEEIRRACIAKLKKESRFRGGKVSVSEDFSRRILQLRRERMDDFKRLKEEGKKPFFIYPSKLAFRNNIGKLIIVA